MAIIANRSIAYYDTSV